MAGYKAHGRPAGQVCLGMDNRMLMRVKWVVGPRKPAPAEDGKPADYHHERYYNFSK